MSELPPAQREPIFNIPAVIVGVLALLALIHVARWLLLDAEQDNLLLLLFAFVPARYQSSLVLGGTLPGGSAAEIWTFVSYAFLHADRLHLGLNALWFLAFGSPVARRFGSMHFLVFFLVAAAAGALAYLVAKHDSSAGMIGASASVSGMAGAAVRFIFQRGGPLNRWRSANLQSYQVPALPLRSVLRDRSVILFIMFWIGLNLFLGLASPEFTGAFESIAWQAHIGGFLAGLLLFGLFDPKPPRGEPAYDADRDAA